MFLRLLCTLVLLKLFVLTASGQKKIFADDFKDNRNEWTLRNNSDFLFDIRNGVLHIEKFQTNYNNRECLWYFKQIPGLDTKNDFSVTFYARFLSGGDIIDRIDFQWGTALKDTRFANSLYQLSFWIKGQVKLDYFDNNWSYLASKNISADLGKKFDAGQFNKYELIQKQGFIVFRINDREVLRFAGKPAEGNGIGFQQCLKTAWEIDRIVIRQDGTLIPAPGEPADSVKTPLYVIRGKAFDSTNGRNSITLIVNDTLRKFMALLSHNPARIEDYRRLTNDTNYITRTKKDGSFQIAARITDSIFFQGVHHFPQTYCVKDLLKRDSIVIRLVPEPCIPYEPCKDSVPSRFYAFVGEKINVQGVRTPYFCDGIIPMDSKFEAEYKIVQPVYGCYERDTIRFTAFDHYGFPAFGKYKTVLLFVSEYCGKLYHEKYQYFAVYRTADGRWASPGNPYRIEGRQVKGIKAREMQFPDSVYFDISGLHPNRIKELYPTPFFKIEGSKAIPVMGTYLEDLFTIEKEGLLKARKIFLSESGGL